MANLTADRNLLFGLLALQNGLINQGQLVTVFQAWTLDKTRDLADHLVVRGDLDLDDRSAVEALVARHIKKHGGDVEQSLATMSVGRSTSETLAQIADPDVDATLARLGTTPTPDDDRAQGDRTASYTVGEVTSAGQRFRVLRPHARGGLGAVFVALDAELHREVALKQILDTHADDPISRQRFLLEAEVTGGLEHPGIVPVYGLGTYGDGRPYYAMRFIKGDSLKEAIDRFHKDKSLKAAPGLWSLELRKLLRRFTVSVRRTTYLTSALSERDRSSTPRQDSPYRSPTDSESPGDLRLAQSFEPHPLDLVEFQRCRSRSTVRTAFLPPLGYPCSHSFAKNLSLELREDRQHSRHRSARRRRQVESFGQ